MIVEHAFGLLAKDRFFKMILKVDSDDPNRVILNQFGIMGQSDIVMNLYILQRIIQHS